MAALESQMSILRKEDEDILKELAGVVYPILALPNEITSEIFVQYVDSGRTPKSPLCLASVCSLWRALALSNSSLWTKFNSGWRRYDLTNLLRIWLPRAGGLPLHLKITLPQSSAQSADILRTLWQYSAQWHSLEIRAPGRITFPDDIPGPFLHSPSLLNFTWRPPLRPRMLGRPYLCFPMRLSFAKCIWNGSPSETGSLYRLSRTPNLEDFEFTCEARNSGPNPAPPPPLILPHLRSIRLCGEHGPELLNYLVLPALEFIEIGFTDESTDEIEGMIARSGCTPRRLDFYMYEPGFERIYRCMTAMPSLRVLEMRCPGGSAADYRDFFDTLAQDLSILPALETLEITHCRAEIELPTLVRMLEARAMGEGKLKSFSLLFEDDGGHESGADLVELAEGVDHALDGIRGLRSQGLKVNIKSNIEWLSESISSQFIAAMGEDNRS
ncbi:hypothetical protein DFH06DRAFT_1472875 [Mycena polygramma]|nr:hypothetical protein DFH06DRAFT_1472875 [Mycena polygramma]